MTRVSVFVYHPTTSMAAATNQNIVEAVEMALWKALPPGTAHTLNIKVFTAVFDYGAGNYHHVSIDIRSSDLKLFPEDRRDGIRKEIRRRLPLLAVEVAFVEMDLG